MKKRVYKSPSTQVGLFRIINDVDPKRYLSLIQIVFHGQALPGADFDNWASTASAKPWSSGQPWTELDRATEPTERVRHKHGFWKPARVAGLGTSRVWVGVHP